jgi:hypothetical protein
MKRCGCLRYLALLAAKRDQSSYIFSEEDEGLVTIESAFPLEEFETGTGALICVCPYYNFLEGGMLIPRAFERIQEKRMRREDFEIIKNAVANCEHFVDSKKFLVFSERYKEVIDNFCRKYSLKLTWRLLKLFLSFLKVRGKYMDKTLCEGVSPAEKKNCFDQLWVEAFGRYLVDVGFVFNK